MAGQPKFNLAVSRPGLLTNSKLSPNGRSVRWWQQKTTHDFPGWRQRRHKELFLFNFKILFLQRWKQHDQTRTRRETDKIQQEISRVGASQSQRAQKKQKEEKKQEKSQIQMNLFEMQRHFEQQSYLSFFPVLDFKAAFFLFLFMFCCSKPHQDKQGERICLHHAESLMMCCSELWQRVGSPGRRGSLRLWWREAIN